MLGPMLTLGIAQTRPAFLDVQGNLQRALECIESVSADIYLFPELFLSGYAFSRREEVEACALTQDGPLIGELTTLTADRGIAVCGGYAERGSVDGRLYNSSFFIGDGRLISNYRKTHLFFRENEFFSPGDTGFEVFEYRRCRLGMMICYDWIYPEAARTLALRGAQVILHPANLVLPYCQRAMFARAVENRVFVATANRVGGEDNAFGDDLCFTGQSQVVSPSGEYVLTFSDSETAIRTVTIDPPVADDKRLNPFNSIMADRRPDTYE